MEDYMAEVPEDTEEPEEWDYDEEEPNHSGALGTFIVDGAANAAVDNYMPIAAPGDAPGEDDTKTVHYEPTQAAAATEHFKTVPKNRRRRFWQYRHELYEQMIYIVVLFATTELGSAWLTHAGWSFHHIEFASATPRPLTNLKLRHMSRRETLAYYAKLDLLVVAEQSKIMAWQDSVRRCALQLLGSNPAHLIRMAAWVRAEMLQDLTPDETTLIRNAVGKAETFLPATAADTTDWCSDAAKAYSI
jgi:hypothetical protein